MKKLLFLFLSFGMLLSCSNPNGNEESIDLLTNIPDKNFEQGLINLGYDDKIDHYVKTSNISSIKSLDISDFSISNLTGIQDFIELNELNCSNNLLTFLDISNNNNLTNLNCSNNIIKLLDVSKNIFLERIDCSKNALTALDLRNNSNSSIVLMNATENSKLDCILIDNGFIPPLCESLNNSLGWCKDYSAMCLADCSCDYLLNVAVNLYVDLSLQQYSHLKFAGNSVYIPNYGNGGIIIASLGNDQYFAWDASDPNHTASPCSVLELSGLEATCGCSDHNKYNLVNGMPIGNETLLCQLKNYRVTGRNLLIVSN